jgi:hypothetical protein
MTVHVTRQPNIEHGLKDQTSIALTSFNTILETYNTRAELESHKCSRTLGGQAKVA